MSALQPNDRKNRKRLQNEYDGTSRLHDAGRVSVDLALFSLGDGFDIFNATQPLQPDAANVRYRHFGSRDVDGDCVR